MDAAIRIALLEDIGPGDVTSLSCIPARTKAKAHLLIKEKGLLAGIAVAERIFFLVDPSLKVKYFLKDGALVKPGMIAFEVSGSAQSILLAERLVLNSMQRMSGIATKTALWTSRLKGTGTRLLDTRKTTPGFRVFEKMAVNIGGGMNHRFGLYDMILIKDNHVDYAGGIAEVLSKAKTWVKKNKPGMKIEIEARNLDDVHEVLETGGAHRIMLDNFSIPETRKAVQLIGKKAETEASGRITLEDLRKVAKTGVNFISCGALTYSYNSLDLSLKAFRDS